MEMQGNTLAIVLLVVGLVVGAGAGYMLKPEPYTYDQNVQVETVTPDAIIVGGSTIILMQGDQTYRYENIPINVRFTVGETYNIVVTTNRVYISHTTK